MNLNHYLPIENRARRWCVFLLLGCRKLGVPCDGLHANKAFFKICMPIWALSGPNLSLVVLSIGQIMTYFMFPECDQTFLRGTKNPFKFTPLPTCGVTPLLVVRSGAYYLEGSTALYFCHSVFIDKSIFSLNLPCIRTPCLINF